MCIVNEGDSTRRSPGRLKEPERPLGMWTSRIWFRGRSAWREGVTEEGEGTEPVGTTGAFEAAPEDGLEDGCVGIVAGAAAVLSIALVRLGTGSFDVGGSGESEVTSSDVSF